jgi:carbohydrate-binding DOMON domain-containing protein
MSVELRQVANDFAYRVKKYSGYDVNGYRFRTINYDQSWPNGGVGGGAGGSPGRSSEDGRDVPVHAEPWRRTGFCSATSIVPCS